MRMLVAFSLLATPALAQDAPLPPIQVFLRAADAGDAEGMMAALGQRKLPKEISGCYLRAVYGTPAGGVLAGWMCAEGQNASRVVLGEVGQTGSKAILRIVRETRNKVPAPERSGSAFKTETKVEASQ